jgi:outer membrane protein TolC
LRAAKLSDQIALESYNAVVADILLQVRRTFYEVLLNGELIAVREKSLQLLERQLQDAQHRFGAGAGTQLDVLSAQTALTEARSNKVQAFYDYNVAIASLERAAGLVARPVE